MTTPKNAVILVVEDSPTQLEQLLHLLRQHGYGVMGAQNGREALELISTRRPSLVISDIMMPEMDGYHLSAAIRRNDSLAGLPIMLLTALSSTRDIISAMECGADNFVTKPYNEEYLLSKIAAMLDAANDPGRDRNMVETTIRYQGTDVHIHSDMPRLLDLLISTYEVSVLKNRELSDARNTLSDKVAELEAALETVKQLEGIIPICMYCKKIRDDKDYWHQLEQFITDHSGAVFSHGMCPECYDRVTRTEMKP